jgi:phosphoglucosamine mutase
VPKGVTLEGLKVVVDCANGAAYKITPWVLRELGAEVITINDKPDGININDGCGSLYLDYLSNEVRKHGAHVGVANDGDADRTLFCDENGSIVNGDHFLGMWAVEMKKEGKLNGDTVVATVMSNLGLENYLMDNGIKLIRTKVGDRFVTERMLDGGFNLGGEQSGHVIFFDYNTTGDGPITALHVLYLMKKKSLSLSSLAGEIELYPQILINVPVRRKRDFKTHSGIQAEIGKAEEKLGSKGRVLVRPSGTERKIRVMLEGEDRDLIKRLGNSIAKVIEEKMA